MKIQSVEFAGALSRPAGERPGGGLVEIAFSGRSNVGKSSLINRLLGRTRARVARVSKAPGRTQQIHFYRVRAIAASGGELRFFLVDLPGYGYARVPAALRRSWRPLLESYLSGSPALRGVVQLLDARHEPTAEDRQMVEYLASAGKPLLFALTKVDKLSWSARKQRIARIVRELALDEEQVIPFSAVTGEGRDALLDSLEQLLREGGVAT